MLNIFQFCQLINSNLLIFYKGPICGSLLSDIFGFPKAIQMIAFAIIGYAILYFFLTKTWLGKTDYVKVNR